MTWRLAAVTVGITVLSAPLFADERRIVGGRDFCVPAANLVKPDPTLERATRHLPKTGFAFLISTSELRTESPVVPQKNINAQEMPITGTIEPLSDGRAIDRYPRDHYWYRMARSPHAIVEADVAQRHLVVFENAKREFWVIWQIPKGAPVTTASVDDKASVVASCTRTSFRNLKHRQVDETVSCHRNIRAGDFRVSYDFDPSNLRAADKLDAAVSSKVLGWLCRA
jgi:hypothetical protein